MNSFRFLRNFSRSAFIAAAGAAGLLSAIANAQVGPSVVTVSPYNGEYNAPANASVVFTFSAPMNTAATSATFFEGIGTIPTTSSSWNTAGTVLTCTPAMPWPAQTQVSWLVSGEDKSGNMLTGVPSGFFSTGSSSNNCPQSVPGVSMFSVNNVWFYTQSGSGAPVIGGTSSDAFIGGATAILASNAVASGMTLSLPNGGSSNLFDTLGLPLAFETGNAFGDSNSLAAAFPSGMYTFEIQGISPSGALPPSVTVDLNVPQPVAPDIANFAAAQAVNPAQPFKLMWNAFAPTLAAGEVGQILVSIGYSTCPMTTGFETNLPSTATSVTIPANALPASTSYSGGKASIAFVARATATHSAPSYETDASRETITYFTLTTTAASNSPPPSTNLPSITKQPASLTVITHAPATFTVTAKGTAPLTYQWQFNGASLSNSANISGVSTAILKIKSAQSNDAGSYTVIVTDKSGSVTSSTATLAVDNPPVITVQPKSEVAAIGSNTSFSVTATGTAPLGYHWKRNGAALSDTATYSGTTTSLLKITDPLAVNAGIYTVVVSNAVGSVTSAKATLTLDVPPSITGQPTNRTVTAGKPATFSVKAAGTAPLSYHWRRGGTNLANAAGIVGVTTPILTISKAEAANAGSYDVTVSNAVGVVTSSSAALTVTP